MLASSIQDRTSTFCIASLLLFTAAAISKLTGMGSKAFHDMIYIALIIGAIPSINQNKWTKQIPDSFIVLNAVILLPIIWSPDLSIKGLEVPLRSTLMALFLYLTVYNIGHTWNNVYLYIFCFATLACCLSVTPTLYDFYSQNNELRQIEFPKQAGNRNIVSVLFMLSAYFIICNISKKHSLTLKTILGITLLSTLIIGFTIQSRGSMLACMLAITALFAWKLKSNQSLKYLLHFSVFIIISASLLLITNGIDGIQTLIERGDSRRFSIYLWIINDFMQQPFFGTGYLVNDKITLDGITYPNEHNMPLAVLRQGGIFTLSLLVIFSIGLTKKFKEKKYKIEPNVAGACAFTASLFLFTAGYPVFRADTHFFAFWAPICFLFYKWHASLQNQRNV